MTQPELTPEMQRAVEEQFLREEETPWEHVSGSVLEFAGLNEFIKFENTIVKYVDRTADYWWMTRHPLAEHLSPKARGAYVAFKRYCSR